MKIKHLILAVFCCCFVQLSAQDFHNSFIQFAPMTLNPALTGGFYGNLRANAIVRDQGRSTAGGGDEFQDFSIGLDYNFDWGLTKDDWVSAGINFSRSGAAGVGNFRRQFSGISAAYHLAFGKKSDKVFTLGVRYGNYTTGFRNVNVSDYEDPETVFGNNSTDLAQWLDSQFGQGIDPRTKETGDYMVGLMLDLPVGKKSDVRIGIASDHLLQPRLSVTVDTSGIGGNPPPTFEENLNRRFNAFVFLYTDINKKLTFNPNLLIQRSDVTTNVLFQALFNYVYSQEKQIGFVFGLGARFANSFDIPIYAALDMKDLRVGLSYDTNISGLRPSNGTFGALELGVTKIFNWNKKTEVKPVFICPRL